MTYPLHVALIWHQHQPLYKSPVAGKYRMPWVRLHGIKDYLDLVLLLERFPRLHQTVNLVPSLIIQIEEYVAGSAFDPYLELTLTPTEKLNTEQLRFVIERFFDSHYPHMIEPYPRYRQLYEQRESQGVNWCLQYWTQQDFNDLLAWHNLSWFDPLFQEDPEIEGWIKMGSGFTLADRQRIYAKQQQILSAIIPQHAKMQSNGQLELTTSPYTHPILPLLVSERSARVARPGLPLPRYSFHWKQDVHTHLERAKQVYRERFGRDPRGLWPSEQSVSPAILPLIQKQGFDWIISDEGVLGWSLGHPFHRDEQGHILEPDQLYRPYRLETELGELAIIFRDHRLSDLIGFSYSAMSADAAAKDLIGHLETIRNRLPQDQPWLVTIALDGENCWEYYPQDGKPFLENLYTRLSQHPSLRLVTVSEFLDQFPPTEFLSAEQLHSGSWIESDFTTWIGDPVKNRAWELLAQARQVIQDHPNANPQAWEALWAAEGSDWFWWFGMGHSSAHDAVFDQLFREHLQALYSNLGETIPTVLYFPLEDHDGLGDRLPQGFIHPTINGRPAEREWTQAGRVEIGGARGTMHRNSTVRRLWYGFDHFNFYLRLDFSSAIQRPKHLQVLCFYPNRITINSAIPLQALPEEAPLNYHYRHLLQLFLPPPSTGQHPTEVSVKLLEAGEYHSWHAIDHQIQAVVDTCLEVAVPWSNLGTQPGQEMQFIIVAAERDTFQEAIPPKATIALRIP
ncbi:glycoside hydrolase [Synechococcus sp. Nb3U1]|uniref:glycoside hydrolase n=1 Tax=Synechococcus sp. Nb3U1 TaxID=1914529 RepID=UPI001F341372|nr:glycoside hydrolase [Synechococcus sp. Nb3U1]MCF2972244.1 glycoside hydrolase [Synechococcus sp. Nb3U1]